jgi:hypothetical protein
MKTKVSWENASIMTEDQSEQNRTSYLRHSKQVASRKSLVTSHSPPSNNPRRVSVYHSVRLRTPNKPRNRLLEIRPLRFTWKRHVTDIVDVQLPVAPSECGPPSVFSVPL